MTTACAWCDAVLTMDLVALALRGLSNGVCLSCMPRVFGERAFAAYLREHRTVFCEACEKFQLAPPENGTFERGEFQLIGTALSGVHHA